MFTVEAIKQSLVEQFGAKKNSKWPFPWPLTGLSQIMVSVVC